MSIGAGIERALGNIGAFEERKAARTEDKRRFEALRTERAEERQYQRGRQAAQDKMAQEKHGLEMWFEGQRKRNAELLNQVKVPPSKELHPWQQEAIRQLNAQGAGIAAQKLRQQYLAQNQQTASNNAGLALTKARTRAQEIALDKGEMEINRIAAESELKGYAAIGTYLLDLCKTPGALPNEEAIKRIWNTYNPENPITNIAPQSSPDGETQWEIETLVDGRITVPESVPLTMTMLASKGKGSGAMQDGAPTPTPYRVMDWYDDKNKFTDDAKLVLEGVDDMIKEPPALGDGEEVTKDKGYFAKVARDMVDQAKIEQGRKGALSKVRMTSTDLVGALRKHYKELVMPNSRTRKEFAEILKTNKDDKIQGSLNKILQLRYENKVREDLGLTERDARSLLSPEEFAMYDPENFEMMSDHLNNIVNDPNAAPEDKEEAKLLFADAFGDDLANKASEEKKGALVIKGLKKLVTKTLPKRALDPTGLKGAAFKAAKKIGEKYQTPEVAATKAYREEIKDMSLEDVREKVKEKEMMDKLSKKDEMELNELYQVWLKRVAGVVLEKQKSEAKRLFGKFKDFLKDVKKEYFD